MKHNDEMNEAINDVTESIQEATTAIVEYQNAIRQLKWDQFDYIQDEISTITDEADFLIELLSSEDLYRDNGQLTNAGLATMGLHAEDYKFIVRRIMKIIRCISLNCWKTVKLYILQRKVETPKRECERKLERNI